MEEEANQLYRRPHITGQARDEEKEDWQSVVVTMMNAKVTLVVQTIIIDGRPDGR